MGVSRIRVTIDRLVLNGFGQLEGKALAQALQAQLSQGLALAASRDGGMRSHRTPVMKLGPMTLPGGPAGAARLGKDVAGAIGKRLRP